VPLGSDNPSPEGLAFDASVLIDYAAIDLTLLAAICADIAPIFVPTTVLGEVDGLDETTAVALGITVCEPTMSQIDEALARPKSLSFNDHLCFTLARDQNLTCVTNDGALLRYCDENSVHSMRGFRPLIMLVEAGVITPLVCVRSVRAVHARNRYITRAIVSEVYSEVWTVRLSRRATQA
jgi:hypothetical protein